MKVKPMHLVTSLADLGGRSRGAALALVAAAAAAGLATGCGSITSVSPDGGGAGGAGGASVVTVAEACRQQSNAVCDALDKCANVAVRFFYGDKPTCVSRQMLGCMTDQMVPGTTRTPADILGCARDVTGAICPDLLASKFPPSCGVKPGTQPNGTACGSDWQCTSTFCSKDAPPCGTCATRAGAGAACTLDAGCEVGLVCANSQCVTPGTLAQACDANHPCRSDFYCTKALGGSCQPKVGVGGSCMDSDKACDTYQSVGCNPFNHTCETFGVASGGDACGIVNNALTVCVDLGPCPGFSILQAQGVCANPAADGAPCGDAASGVVCLPPATCESGVCQLPSVPNCQ